MECPICIEAIVDAFTCISCNYTTCLKCIQRHILNNRTCINCDFIWSYEYINETMSNDFINGEFRESVENALFRQELTYNNDQHIKFLNQYSDKLAELNAQLMANKMEIQNEKLAFKRQKDLNLATYYELLTKYGREIKKVSGPEYLKLAKKIDEINIYIISYEDIDLYDLLMVQTVINNEIFELKTHYKKIMSREYIEEMVSKKCPICPGTLSEFWSCDKCGSDICEYCYCKKDTDHICDENDKLTILAIKKETHPCPKCAEQIYKINGCDQMWCTLCGTAFSWETGKIDAGNVHNPHYFEQRVDQCLLPSFNVIYKQLGGDRDYYQNVYRQVTGLTIRIPTTYGTSNFNRDIRIRYVMGNIGESKFKAELYKRDRLAQKSFIFAEVADTFKAIGRELFHNLATPIEFENLRIYFNNTMLEKAKIFNSRAKLIDNNWSMY